MKVTCAHCGGPVPPERHTGHCNQYCTVEHGKLGRSKNLRIKKQKKRADVWLTSPDLFKECGNPDCDQMILPRKDDTPYHYKRLIYHSRACGEQAKRKWRMNPENYGVMHYNLTKGAYRHRSKDERQRMGEAISKSKKGKTTWWNLSQKVEWRFIPCVAGCGRACKQETRTGGKPRNSYYKTCGDPICRMSILKHNLGDYSAKGRRNRNTKG